MTLDFGGGVFTGSNRWVEIAARTNGAAPVHHSFPAPARPGRSHMPSWPTARATCWARCQPGRLSAHCLLYNWVPARPDINISGSAATAVNGVVTTGSYADPSWITSLAGSKISGNISGNAANITGTLLASQLSGTLGLAQLPAPVLHHQWRERGEHL